MDGQEIGREILRLDEGQFLVQQALDLAGHAVGIADAGVSPGQVLQPVLRRPARRRGLLRIVVGQVLQVEPGAGQKGLGLAQGIRRVGE